MRKIRYSNVASTVALVFSVAALCLGGAVASKTLIGSSQIKNGTIGSQDLRNNGIKSADLGNGTIGSIDVGDGQIRPQDVTMPAPAQFQQTAPVSVAVGTDFELVSSVGTYDKVDPASILSVTWTGTAAAPPFGGGCIFQLRIDGQPSAGGGGMTYVPLNGVESVAAGAIFAGLSVGPHRVEVWARHPQGSSEPCTVGPAAAGIPQTFVVSEEVV